MKKIYFAAIALVALATGTAFAGDWLRAGDVWLKGLTYLGTSRVQLADAAGNLSTTSGAFSSNVAVAGTLAVTGATTLRNASLSLSSVASVAASTTSAQGIIAANGLVTTLSTQATSSATAGDSLTLPSAVAGLVVVTCNGAAANAIDVFPFTSDSINKETADTAIALAAGECMICIAFTAVRWGCVIGSAT